MRTSLAGNPSAQEILRRVRRSVLEGQSHQNLPFDHLVRLLNPVRFPDRAPLFQVKLDLQNLPVRLQSSTVTLDPLLIDPRASQLDLLLALTETITSVQGLWQYSTDLFKASTIQKMSRQYRTLLSAFVANPSITLLELNLLLEEEELQWRKEQQISQKSHRQLKSTRLKPVMITTQGD